MARAIDFYCNVMGGEVQRQVGWEKGSAVEIDKRLGLEKSGAKVAVIRLGASYVELFEYSSPPPKPKPEGELASDLGIRHICFVVDDCVGEYERLKALGVHFNAPPYNSGSGMVFTYGRDPDGNLFELLEISKTNDFPNNYA